MAGDGGEEVESVSRRMSSVICAVFVCTTSCDDSYDNVRLEVCFEPSTISRFDPARTGSTRTQSDQNRFWVSRFRQTVSNRFDQIGTCSVRAVPIPKYNLCSVIKRRVIPLRQ
jgi:hypothetical protein